MSGQMKIRQVFKELHRVLVCSCVLGHLRWSVSYKRGPDCGPVGTFGRNNDDKDYWGKNDLMDQCCFEETKMDCYNDEDCREVCSHLEDNKQRFIGADVGYALDWQIDDEGLPRGCAAFRNKDGSDKEEETFRTRKVLLRRNEDAGCPDQKMKDGEGLEMHETVKMYANDLPKWHEDFLKVFMKMQANGYSAEDLTENDLTSFWKHKN